MMNFKLWIEANKPGKLRGPREDLYQLMDANFDHGVIVGPQWEYVKRLAGGVSSDPNETQRVDALAGKISGPGGYWERIVVDEENNVVEGQHRLAAARKLGYKKVPILRVMDLGRVFGFQEMMTAAAAVVRLDRERLRQIVIHAMDALYEEKGSVEEALQYNLSPAYNEAFHAAIKAAKPWRPQWSG